MDIRFGEQPLRTIKRINHRYVATPKSNKLNV